MKCNVKIMVSGLVADRFLQFLQLKAKVVKRTDGMVNQAITLYRAIKRQNMIKNKSASNVMSTNLGELELHVLEILWKKPHIDAREVREGLGALRAPSLSTVQSTLERLYRKTYVDRIKQGHAYTYHASVSRGSLLGRMMGDVIQLLHDGRMETILSSFVQAAADLDEGSLDSLEALIREKKRQQPGKPDGEPGLK